MPASPRETAGRLMTRPPRNKKLTLHRMESRQPFCARSGFPAPVFSATLAYYDMARAPRVSAALTQAQRDFFGSHTYERVDEPGHYHIEWTADRSETKID